MSLTLTFTGDSPVLESNFFPPIYLDKTRKWSCGLLNFEVYNSIPNVDDSNNCLHILEDTISLKQDEVSDLETLVKKIRLKISDIKIEAGSYAEGKIKIKCSKTLFNLNEDSILRDLGFDPKLTILEANVEHFSYIPAHKKITNLQLQVGTTFRLPKGSYELEDIAREIKKFGIDLTAIRNELKCRIKCNKHTLILDSRFNSIGSLLGFKRFASISEGQEVISDHIVDIFKVNAIAIECSIVSGSWKNGQPSHILHQFFPNVSPGYKVVEAPQNVIYLDLLCYTLDTITIRIVDQEGRLVDFRGETVTVRLHLKQND